MAVLALTCGSAEQISNAKIVTQDHAPVRRDKQPMRKRRTIEPEGPPKVEDFEGVEGTSDGSNRNTLGSRPMLRKRVHAL